MRVFTNYKVGDLIVILCRELRDGIQKNRIIHLEYEQLSPLVSSELPPGYESMNP